MKISKNQYADIVKQKSPPTPIFKNCVMSFIVGGSICVFGELLTNLFQYLEIGEEQVKKLIPIILIFLTAILTAMQIFDDIGKKVGAGTLVPITGFANAVSSAAIEFKTEGFILGVGAKMFTIAGPVIVYGTVASVVYGIIYWITTLF